MKDLLPDICDKYEDRVSLLPVPFVNFGKQTVFFGEAVTVRCFHDCCLLTEALSEDGTGKILVVDGSGSTERALMGEELARLAVDNNWQGVIVYGAVRDAGVLQELPIGVKALAVSPLKANKHCHGDRDTKLRIEGCTIRSGDYVYVDLNGVLITPEPLDI